MANKKKKTIQIATFEKEKPDEKDDLIKITRYANEDIKKILPYPGNWRVHPYKQKRLLNDSVNEIGFKQPIIVNEQTMHIMDGHLRYEQALTNNMKKIPVCYISIPESEEEKNILYFDTVTREAGTDQEKWLKIAERANVDSQEIQQMIAKIQKDLNLKKGKYEEELPTIKKKYKYILIVYKNEANYINHLEKLGNKKAKFINIVDGDKVEL